MAYISAVAAPSEPPPPAPELKRADDGDVMHGDELSEEEQLKLAMKLSQGEGLWTEADAKEIEKRNAKAKESGDTSKEEKKEEEAPKDKKEDKVDGGDNGASEKEEKKKDGTDEKTEDAKEEKKDGDGGLSVSDKTHLALSIRLFREHLDSLEVESKVPKQRPFSLVIEESKMERINEGFLKKAENREKVDKIIAEIKATEVEAGGEGNGKAIDATVVQEKEQEQEQDVKVKVKKIVR